MAEGKELQKDSFQFKVIEELIRSGATVKLELLNLTGGVNEDQTPSLFLFFIDVGQSPNKTIVVPIELDDENTEYLYSSLTEYRQRRDEYMKAKIN